MLTTAQALQRFGEVPHVQVHPQALLSQFTRFAIGGPAAAVVDVKSPQALPPVFEIFRNCDTPYLVIGGGSNLIVSDVGFPGFVLRFTAGGIERHEDLTLAQTGVVWQDLVDFHVQLGLGGMEKMTGIPGWLGGAVYGNAGAYGQTLMDFAEWIEVFDGRSFRRLPNADCGFVYRSSYFKTRKDWILTTAALRLRPGDQPALAATAAEILETRNAKFPPSMKCAGSIFKNQIADRLPESALARVPVQLIRGGKIPSAWFLEQVGAKGLRHGGIVVADYHANLIYNTGSGTAAELLAVIDELKARAEREFSFSLEEEVQFVGFPDRVSH
jgi:UDP-N-acetylmuramate dehydrogenase